MGKTLDRNENLNVFQAAKQQRKLIRISYVQNCSEFSPLCFPNSVRCSKKPKTMKLEPHLVKIKTKLFVGMSMSLAKNNMAHAGVWACIIVLSDFWLVWTWNRFDLIYKWIIAFATCIWLIARDWVRNSNGVIFQLYEQGAKHLEHLIVLRECVSNVSLRNWLHTNDATYGPRHEWRGKS